MSRSNGKLEESDLFGELPADAPKTDRELLLQLLAKVDNINEKLNGDNGLCSAIERQNERIAQLERSKWYFAGALALLIMLVGAGRLIEILYVVPK